MEIRKERFLIINGWQHLEDIRENVLGLKICERNKTRRLQLGGVKFYETGGASILPGVRIHIMNNPARKSGKTGLPHTKILRNITEKQRNTSRES